MRGDGVLKPPLTINEIGKFFNPTCHKFETNGFQERFVTVNNYASPDFFKFLPIGPI
jgi:hypothetical protein